MPEVARPTPRIRSGGPAFSLLELLIVILLMSVMAFLIVGVFSQGKREKGAFEIMKIREWLQPAPAKMVELVCTDECAHCYFHKGGGKMEKAPFSLPPLRAYVVGRYSQAERVEFGRYHDHPVCLRFRYRPDGSTSRMILEAGESFYYIPAYFGKTERFPSLDDAVDRWLEGGDLLRNRWDYY